MRNFGWAAAAVALTLGACGTQADNETENDGETLTIYSARHYDSDYALYEAFERDTGIKVNVVEAEGDLLIERVKADGERSAADVIITVDAGRLWRADEEGLFAPLDSALLNERVPANFRHPDGHWYGIATRARVIVYAEDRVDAAQLTGYASLADPQFEGRVCARSSGNIYNISLLAALVERWGETEAEEWARGVAANFARDPVGGDSDQIKAVKAGECDVALVNHYYLARMMVDENEDVSGVKVAWPQADGGVHVNISGGGVAKDAPNPELARQFLEYAMSDASQRLFADLTGEYPVVSSVTYTNPALAEMGEFDTDPLSVNVYGVNQGVAQQIFDRVGWQ
ncbi:MAG: extracellular solute-binding protein [Sphingomonas sp.]|nr:extracellular solute-binding protein [Sphingomonas sp.]